MSTFLIADTHFGHANIIRYCNRPFADVEEMDRTLRDCWNTAVGPGDDVIVLGDFACRLAPDRLRRLFDSLSGRKHLIVGNHDDRNTLELDLGIFASRSFFAVFGRTARRALPLCLENVARSPSRRVDAVWTQSRPIAGKLSKHGRRGRCHGVDACKAVSDQETSRRFASVHGP